MPNGLSDRLIRKKQEIPGTSSWTPGTLCLYPRPNFMKFPRINEFNSTLPIWNAKCPGLKRQDAMFTLADWISPDAVYIAVTNGRAKIAKIGK